MQQSQQSHHLFWKDKRVLITGGTKGLGKALTEYLAGVGAKVCIVARTEEDLISVSEPSDRIFMIRADISDKDDIYRIAGQTIGMLEGIDVLINNASTLGPTPLRSLLDTPCEDLEKVLQINLLGPFRLIKATLPYMKFHGGGIVVNISSDAAISAYPTWGAYSVSKAALDHMTAIWATELKADNIKFVALDPGDMNTQMHFQAIPDANPDDLLQPDAVASDLAEFISKETFVGSRYSADEWRAEL